MRVEQLTRPAATVEHGAGGGPVVLAAGSVITAIRLRRCAAVGRRVRAFGRIWIHGDGRVLIGDDVTLDGSHAPIELFAWADADLVIGSGTRIEGGASIECTRSIRIGARVRVGTFARIMDNHFHALLGNRHVSPEPQPVVIGDDVVLGPRTIVMAGATIPAGTVHGAASIVRRDRRRTARVPDA